MATNITDSNHTGVELVGNIYLDFINKNRYYVQVELGVSIFTTTWVIITCSILLRTIIKHITLRGPLFTLLFALSFFDIFFCIFELCLLLIHIYLENTPEELRKSFNYFIELTLTNSAIVSTFLAINQYISIKHSLRYEVIACDTKVKLTLIVVLVSTVLIQIASLGSVGHIYFQVIILLMALVIISVSMVHVIAEANSALREIIKSGITFSQNINQLRVLKKRRKTVRIIACKSFLSILLLVAVSSEYIYIGIKNTPEMRLLLISTNIYIATNSTHYLTIAGLRFFLKKDLNDFRMRYRLFRKSSRVAPRKFTVTSISQ